MPKLICTPCQVELLIHYTGITVVEHAAFGPYKLWSADEFKCPGCGAVIITNYANRPVSEHYMDGFAEKLASIPPDERRDAYEHLDRRLREAAAALLVDAGMLVSAKDVKPAEGYWRSGHDVYRWEVVAPRDKHGSAGVFGCWETLTLFVKMGKRYGITIDRQSYEIYANGPH